MLQLVGSDWGSDTAEGPGDVEEEPEPADAGALRRLALELLMQVPTRPDEALAVVGHLEFLVRWRAGMIEEQRAVERRAADARGESQRLFLALEYSALEERLDAHGYRGAALRYAADLLRRGFLGDGFAKA